jgi:uncharacterized protein YjiS (DUF1127 family)
LQKSGPSEPLCAAIKSVADPKQETTMTLHTVMRFLRARRTYRTVVQELSNYSDRELHDIGIDRIDIHEIARLASRER